MGKIKHKAYTYHVHKDTKRLKQRSQGTDAHRSKKVCAVAVFGWVALGGRF